MSANMIGVNRTKHCTRGIADLTGTLVGFAVGLGVGCGRVGFGVGCGVSPCFVGAGVWGTVGWG